MAARRRRVFLSSTQAFWMRQRVYMREDCVEIDELDHYDITRWRVYFEDVLAVTRHKIYGWSFVVAMCLINALLLLIMFAVSASGGGSIGALIMLIIAAPFLLLLILRLVLRVDIITVCGRRTRAEMQFFLRKGKARRVFEDLVQRVSLTQAELEARYATEEVAAGPSFGPPPAEAAVPPEQ